MVDGNLARAVLATALATGLALGSLGGCASEAVAPFSGGTGQTFDSPTIPVSAKSAIDMVGAVATDEYSDLEVKVLDEVPDAKLIGVRSYATFFPGNEASSGDWMYLYGSLQEQKAYSVMNGRSVIVAPYSDLEMTEEQYAAIPSVQEIVIDADIALARVLAEGDEELEPLTSCDVVLLTSLMGEDDDGSAMQWYFDMNYSVYEQERSAYQSAPTTADVQTDAASDGSDVLDRGCSYCVDARTGECLKTTE